MARMGMIPGGMYRNRKHFGDKLDLSSVEVAIADIMLDPQTSGGLLFAVDESDTQELLRRLRDSGVPAARIGILSAFDGVYIRAK
jgi:selenide,water dikinase